jgi:hypothetical protein
MSSPIKGTMPGLVRDPLHSDLRAAGCRQPRQRNPGGAASIPNHHFEHERRPQADMSAEAQAYHAAITDTHAQMLMRGTGKEMRA